MENWPKAAIFLTDLTLTEKMSERNKRALSFAVLLGFENDAIFQKCFYFGKWCDFLENWNALEFGNDDTFSMFGGTIQENYHFGEIIQISTLKEKGSLTSISKDMTLVWKVLEIGGNLSVILDSQTRDRFFSSWYLTIIIGNSQQFMLMKDTPIWKAIEF